MRSKTGKGISKIHAAAKPIHSSMFYISVLLTVKLAG